MTVSNKQVKLYVGLKSLPGPHDYPPNEQDFFNPKQTGQLIDGPPRKKRILVYFIGGITYGEIAAIRFLNKIFEDKKFIIATTQIINGDVCMEMMRGQINNRLNINTLIMK